VASVRERTIPTERPPLLGEVGTNFGGLKVPRGQRDGSLRPYSRISRPDPLSYTYLKHVTFRKLRPLVVSDVRGEIILLSRAR
jgi:hypothetical protein